MTLIDPEIDVHLTPDYAARALREDARDGLTAEPKWLAPKWFYDARGSELFEEITRLPEYYPTRAEREILDARSGEIAALTGAHTLVELGSGSSEKTRLLLDGLRDHGTLTTFVPLDVSESALREAAAAINADYPELVVHGVVGDFTEHLDKLPGDAPRVVAFLGGTIGNLLPDEREVFYASIRDVLEPGEWLLLGTDLVKDPATLVAAYDDSAGVTAEFNRTSCGCSTGSSARTSTSTRSAHVAVWDAENEWIEMHLRADRAMQVLIPEIGLEVEFAEGEELSTEVSAKFHRYGVEAELGKAGFTPGAWWTDSEERFALSLWQAV